MVLGYVYQGMSCERPVVVCYYDQTETGTETDGTPRKARLKTGEPRKRKKPGYRGTNARAYNQSLKKRGQLSLYCPDDELKTLFINAHRYVKGASGRDATYIDAYTELIDTSYRLFGLGMCQITGQAEEFWAICGFDIALPGFAHLSCRFAVLTISIRQRRERLRRCLANGEAVSLIVDSTGMQFGRANEWREQKYARESAHTQWHMVNLSIDPDVNVHAVGVTETTVADAEATDALLAVDCHVDRLIADGTFNSIETTETWSARGVLPVIPPAAHAMIHGDSHTRWHDRVLG